MHFQKSDNLCRKKSHAVARLIYASEQQIHAENFSAEYCGPYINLTCIIEFIADKSPSIYMYALSDFKRETDQRVLFESPDKHQNISLLTD